MNNYHLPPTYTARLEPDYFNDVLHDADKWQADVYALAALLARRGGGLSLVDVGCGRAGKLMRYADEFGIVGIDYGENIVHCMQSYPKGAWIECDLNSQVVDGVYFRERVIICADVIEHIPDPSALLQTLRNASETAVYVLVSTPDRLRMYGHEHNGPPANKAHVREWTLAELVTWFKSEGLPIVWQGWTVSYEGQPDKRNTSLVILSRTETVERLPRKYEVAK